MRRVVELGEADGLTQLAYREGGPFEAMRMMTETMRTRR